MPNIDKTCIGVRRSKKGGGSCKKAGSTERHHRGQCCRPTETKKSDCCRQSVAPIRASLKGLSLDEQETILEALLLEVREDKNQA